METRDATPQEGVIRFDLRFEPVDNPAEMARPEIAALDGWRGVLRRLRVIGRDSARYGGFGFGNLSCRCGRDEPPGRRRFVVSGSQTGTRARLGREGWAVVDAWDLARHRLEARGPVPPSSESLTHAALYDADASLRAVVHAHAPAPWRLHEPLGLPATPDGIGYGTDEMAAAVQRLVDGGVLAPGGVVAMRGHEDGLLAVGRTLDEAGLAFVRVLAAALALEAPS
ncbi:MAG: class II aldolase/adducin family protein [Acidobacteriota bacterium]